MPPAAATAVPAPGPAGGPSTRWNAGPSTASAWPVHVGRVAGQADPGPGPVPEHRQGPVQGVGQGEGVDAFGGPPGFHFGPGPAAQDHLRRGGPSVPSEPTSSRQRSKPVTFLTSGAPDRMSSPRALTAVISRTASRSGPSAEAPVAAAADGQNPARPWRGSGSSASRATSWPPAWPVARSSSRVVPARTLTIISAGSWATTPAGAATSRTSGGAAPPTSHWVRPPTTRTGPDRSDVGWRSSRARSLTPRPRRGSSARSPQPEPPRGRTFSGLHCPSGSKASRSHFWASRSAGENTRGMASRFSRPMPCSPDRVPPAATHASTMSSPAAWTRSSTPGFRRSKTMSGWRLPSPAWNTLPRISSCRAAMALTSSSTSTRRVRGTTQSCR